MKPDDLVPFIRIGELYVTRLVLMLETKPFSNDYKQIVLTPNQFKAISDALYQGFGGISGGKQEIMIELSDRTIKLPDDFQSFKQ